MARRTKEDKDKAKPAKGTKGAKKKTAKPVKKAMVIKEKSVKTVKKAATVKAAAESKPRRGRRYLKAKAKIDPQKEYSFAEAVRLVKKTSLVRFDAKIDLHLNLKDKGLKKEVLLPKPLDLKNPKVLLKSEKKMPLVHVSIGKTTDKEEDLVKNLEAVVGAVGPNNLLKATLTSTMGPGVKVSF